MYHIKLKEITGIVQFIKTCAVLHNLCLDNVLVEREERGNQLRDDKYGDENNAPNRS